MRARTFPCMSSRSVRVTPKPPSPKSCSQFIVTWEWHSGRRMNEAHSLVTHLKEGQHSSLALRAPFRAALRERDRERCMKHANHARIKQTFMKMVRVIMSLGTVRFEIVTVCKTFSETLRLHGTTITALRCVVLKCQSKNTQLFFRRAPSIFFKNNIRNGKTFSKPACYVTIVNNKIMIGFCDACDLGDSCTIWGQLISQPQENVSDSEIVTFSNLQDTLKPVTGP